MALESLIRIARTGVLYGPADAWAKGDFIVSGDRETLRNVLDPLDSGLLIAEEFARLDVSDVGSLVRWVETRGPFDFQRRAIGYNAINIKEPQRIAFERAAPPPPPAQPPQYGPEKPWDMVLAERHARFTEMVERKSVEELREAMWTLDPIDQIRVHHEQVNDWLPALVDYKGVPDSEILGFYLPNLVSDSLSAFMVDERGPDEAGEPWGVEVWWESVLQPIYLQMFQALRRAERGVPAGARCRDCGQIFLILDGRRATYCNSKCRNRFNVRAFRERAKEATGG
jgi:hypothetical protein